MSLPLPNVHSNISVRTTGTLETAGRHRAHPVNALSFLFRSWWCQIDRIQALFNVDIVSFVLEGDKMKIDITTAHAALTQFICHCACRRGSWAVSTFSQNMSVQSLPTTKTDFV